MHIWRDWAANFFFKKIRSIRGVSSSEWPKDAKSAWFSVVIWHRFGEKFEKCQSLRIAYPLVCQSPRFIFWAWNSARACLEWFWCHSDTFATQWAWSRRHPVDLVRQVVRTARLSPGQAQFTAPYLVVIFEKSPNPQKPWKTYFSKCGCKIFRAPLTWSYQKGHILKLWAANFFFKKKIRSNGAWRPSE